MNERRDGYYGHPIVKPPVWEPDIAWYLFSGGLAGGSAALSLAARADGNAVLARRAILVAAAAISVSPVLLIRDLGRPSRFLNMFRVFRPTSPMSMGTWLLSVAGTATAGTAALDVLDVAPGLRRTLAAVAGLSGPAVATYTGVLLADTANPAWHGARRELPFLFASGAAASAGAAAQLVTPQGAAGPARRLMLAGATAEEVCAFLMERRLGATAGAYSSGKAGIYRRTARVLDAAGVALSLTGRPRLRRAGSALVLTAAAARRFSVFHAGFEAAGDPRYTIQSQRRSEPAG